MLRFLPVGLSIVAAGGAAVYEKQCLVLINKNNAKPNDVVALAEMIRKSVSDTYGIVINPEVNYIE